MVSEVSQFKCKRLAPLLTLLILLNATLAHAYSIQVTYNTNLRAAPSLQARIVETAAAGATLTAVGGSNGWLRISRNGNEVWMSKSVSYTRVEGGENAAPRTTAATQIDNCCFIDRQCITDEEWVSGYWAFQNNQCAAPTQQQQSTASQSQPQPGASEDIDNCCFIGWQCNTDEEWVNGYWAFQQGNQCAAPSLQGQQQREQNSNQQQSGQGRQSRQEQQSRQGQQSGQGQQSQQQEQSQREQQSQQEQQSPQGQQDPQDTKTQDPPENEPSGDLVFVRLTEEEWDDARCDIYGGASCD